MLQTNMDDVLFYQKDSWVSQRKKFDFTSTNSRNGPQGLLRDHTFKIDGALNHAYKNISERKCVDQMDSGSD